MSEKRSLLSKTAQSVIWLIAVILLNLAMVLSGVYVLFHLLDYYNPHGFIYHNLRSVAIVIPILFVVALLLFDLLRIDGAFKKRPFRKKRMWLIILCDVLLFIVLSAAVYLNTCTNPLVAQRPVEEFRLATPSAVPEPTDTDSTHEPVETPVPMSEKFAEMYCDPPKEETYGTDNVVETLADGTVKSLVYSYRGRNAAVDIYHYQDGKLEYQVADIYIRDIKCFTTDYERRAGNDLKTQGYAERINAVVAVNGDNFNSGRMEDGIVVRNGAQLFPENGEKQTSFSRDLCVIYYDGSMRVFDCVLDRIDYDEIIASYPLHVFNFGPKLLNDDGTAMVKFNSLLGKENPRTALGYYEPGHYALVVVLGVRAVIDYDGNNLGKSKSPGLTLTDLSALCEKLGFSMAYNLDGGGSASMAWNHSVFGNNDRKHGDVLAILDP